LISRFDTSKIAQYGNFEDLALVKMRNRIVKIPSARILLRSRGLDPGSGCASAGTGPSNHPAKAAKQEIGIFSLPLSLVAH
jgi:hypothetical protein